MNNKHKWVARAASAAVATAFLVGGTATSASADENTWVRNVNSGWCLTAADGGKVHAEFFRWGNDQQWDRRGNNIVRAYTNQCLDSDSSGDVYWMECNGGRNQMWDFRSDGSVVNVATVRWLYHWKGTFTVYTVTNPGGHPSTKWNFSNS
ncbi:ricin-type beta-trefoil lectin domain protein [Streptomyces sp. NPDC006356]